MYQEVCAGVQRTVVRVGVRGRAGCAGVRGRAVCAGVRGRAGLSKLVYQSTSGSCHYLPFRMH